MQEEVTVVVKNIFSMVRSIEYGRTGILLLQQADQPCQEIVGIADGVVIGINQIVPILKFGIRRTVGPEKRSPGRIALTVVKVRTIGMQHNELFAVPFGKFLFHQCQQVVIRKVLTGGQRIFFDEIAMIGLFSEEVYKRIIVTLIGEKAVLKPASLKAVIIPF